MRYIVLSCCFLLAVPAYAEAALTWLTSRDEAVSTALAQNKLILFMAGRET